MIGIGLDAVDIERLREALSRRPRMLERLFTETERRDLSLRVDPVPGYAARFAAKEATMKALGVGLGAFAFGDVEIIRRQSGAPELRAQGAALALAVERGVSSFLVSLTHTEALAQAVVVCQ